MSLDIATDFAAGTGCHKHAAGVVLAGPTPRGIGASTLDFHFRVSFKRKRRVAIREAPPWAYRPVLGPTCPHCAPSLLIRPPGQQGHPAAPRCVFFLFFC